MGTKKDDGVAVEQITVAKFNNSAAAIFMFGVYGMTCNSIRLVLEESQPQFIGFRAKMLDTYIHIYIYIYIYIFV